MRLSRRHARLTVMGFGAVGVLLVGPDMSGAQRREGEGMMGNGSGEGGGLGNGGGARASSGGARMSGNGGHRAPGGEGAAHTSVNRDFNNASLIRTATTSTTSRDVGNSDLDFDLDYDVDAHWHPAARAAASTVGATKASTIGSIAFMLPPSCASTQVNSLSYYQCGSIWYQPQFAGTTVTYVVVASPR
jgi:hypothetical protein